MKQLHLRQQPAAYAGIVIALAESILAFLVAYGVPITAEQNAATVALIAAFIPVIPIVLVWFNVTPVWNPRDNDGTPLIREDEL